MVKKVEKHRNNKRNRSRMTVRAFCRCESPYACVEGCGGDEAELYVNMDITHGNMRNPFA